MSVLIMGYVWKQNIDITSKMVLLALADCADDYGRCWPGVEYLASKCSITKRAINLKISQLCAQEYITKTVNFDHTGRQKSNTYVLNLYILGMNVVQGEGERSSGGRVNDVHPRIDKSILNHHIKPSTPSPTLPHWLNEQDWIDYKQHRKSTKPSLTQLAEKRALAELEKLREKGNDPKEVINQTIINGWKGFFPLKRTGVSYENRSGPQIFANAVTSKIRKDLAEEDYRDPLSPS